MKINDIKNIPTNLKISDIIEMIRDEMKRVTRASYRDQIAQHGIVLFLSRTDVRIIFCEKQEMIIAQKNAKFFRVKCVTFDLD